MTTDAVRRKPPAARRKVGFGRDLAVFLTQARRRWRSTGAFSPSSQSLARAMTRPLREPRTKPARIAEVGPGTGVVTRHIAQLMKPGDTLDIYEVNEGFVRHVEDLIAVDPAFAETRDQIRLHHLDARRMAVEHAFDFVFSGVPFNNFDPATVQDIIEAYVRNTRPGGSITFFEYAGARPARKTLSIGAARRTVSELDSVLKGYLARYRERREVVLRNLPPALVHHLRVPAHGAGARPSQ